MSSFLFVTGKLAAPALKATLERMSPDFDYRITVLPISVAALMKTRWIARHLNDFKACQQIIIPGLCSGDIKVIEARLGIPVIRGPKNLKDLPLFFGREQLREGYGDYRVKIIAEIVDAHLLSREENFARAEYYRASGADIIDLGCPVEGSFPGVTGVIAGLKERGFTVSLDSFDPRTILEADQADLDLLLSINSRNMEIAPRLNCKVVVIPDFGMGLDSLERNARRLKELGIPYILDPILDPLSFGFTEALHRYYEIRRRHPEAEILMGLGNLTELTDADSTGINALMAGVITELEIDYVLTTEVINWARGAVRELDLARRIMYYAHKNRVLPKEIDDGLITVKDPPYEVYTEAELRDMQARLRDSNFRIFTDKENIYIFNNHLFLKGNNIEAMFAQLGVNDPAHAFYLGQELNKAALAVQLSKIYIQDQELRWGYLSERRDAAGDRDL